jgi:L-aspartate oxidase
MGDIRADVHGRTNIKGFFTCGESACNGIHGANRLASNSLLEGLVFGRVIGSQVEEILACTGRSIAYTDVTSQTDRKTADFDKQAAKDDIRDTMADDVGIVRNKKGLTEALNKVKGYKEKIAGMRNETMLDFELQNIALLSELVIESALEREESRGAHFRSDFEKTDDEYWKKHIVKKIG